MVEPGAKVQVTVTVTVPPTVMGWLKEHDVLMLGGGGYPGVTAPAVPVRANRPRVSELNAIAILLRCRMVLESLSTDARGNPVAPDGVSSETLAKNLFESMPETHCSSLVQLGVE